MPIRILLVDDHTMFRQGIRQILQAQEEFEVVGEAENGQQACELAADLSPDVVVMDVHMPVMDGVKATRALMQLEPAPAIIILTMSKHDDYVFEAIKSGARGYYMKDSDSAELIEAIHLAAAGETMLEPPMVQRVLRELRSISSGGGPQSGVALLDEREVEILRLVAAGHTNQAIGEALELSEKTIKNQLSAIFQKLQLDNRTQAAIFALRHGLVTLEELEL